MEKYDLETPLLQVGAGSVWTLRNAVEGTQIFGGIGSGKTTGSGAILAKKFLEKGYGGLVLTVKPDEVRMWEDYCVQTGRKDDLVILSQKNKYIFNFVDYELKRKGRGSGLSGNIVMTLKTVISSDKMHRGFGSEDPFWESALDLMLLHLVDVFNLALGNLPLETMADFVQSLPKEVRRIWDDQYMDKSTFGMVWKTVKKKEDDLDESQKKLGQRSVPIS